MPTSPTGGLSIFINLTILVIGYIFKLIKKIGFKFPIITFIYHVLTDKIFDNISRRIFGYGVAFSLFFLVVYSTSISLYNRLTNESNYDIFAPKMTEVINTITRLIKIEEREEKKLEEKYELYEKYISQDALAINIYSLYRQD